MTVIIFVVTVVRRHTLRADRKRYHVETARLNNSGLCKIGKVYGSFFNTALYILGSVVKLYHVRAGVSFAVVFYFNGNFDFIVRFKFRTRGNTYVRNFPFEVRVCKSVSERILNDAVVTFSVLVIHA